MGSYESSGEKRRRRGKGQGKNMVKKEVWLLLKQRKKLK